MKTTIIFDLDGTLLNTLDDLTDSVNFALSKLGCKLRTADEVRMFVGEGVKLLIERALPKDGKDKAQECLQIFEKHYDKNKENKTRAYDGIDEMLKAVKAAGYKTAIVSNKYATAVSELHKTRFFDIDVAIGEKEGVNKKPAPDMVNLALNLLGVKPENAVYVGDSDIDVLTAQNSNLSMVAVSWGFRPRELLESLSPDAIIDNPSELLNAVKKLG